jgi:hypothetical protein
MPFYSSGNEARLREGALATNQVYRNRRSENDQQRSTSRDPIEEIIFIRFR